MLLSRIIAKQFTANERGSVAVFFGLSCFVLFGLMALAYDTSRLQNTKMRVQAALDASALAAAKMLEDDNVSNSDVRSRAQAYFEARLVEMRVNAASVHNFEVDVKKSNGTVSVETDVKLASLFGSLAEITNSLEWTERSIVRYEAQKIEVALALDMSNSMKYTVGGIRKIDSLKQASNDLVNILHASAGAQDNIRLGLVPYSGAVNVKRFHNDVTGINSYPDDCVVDRPGP
jgi:Flp pilus assembly protein TadG